MMGNGSYMLLYLEGVWVWMGVFHRIVVFGLDEVGKCVVQGR